MSVVWGNVVSTDVPYLDSLDGWIDQGDGDDVASPWLQSGPEGRLEGGGVQLPPVAAAIARSLECS